jgi:hypothetical protein
MMTLTKLKFWKKYLINVKQTDIAVILYMDIQVVVGLNLS